jgi:hypothetical protein
MCQNLDLRFLLFYCLFVSFFYSPPFVFSLVFYCQCFILCFLALVVPSLATSLPQLAWD